MSEHLEKIQSSLDAVLSYAKKENYRGYNKYDGLESPVLYFLSFNIPFLRLIYSQVVMRFPFNIRPFLLIPKTRNPKGIALFAMAYLKRYKALGNREDLDEARKLLDWLIEHPAISPYGMCWGYQHKWQDVGFYAPARFPNRVVTYFVDTALLDFYDETGEEKYFNAARESLHFLLNAPKVLYEDENMKCLSYVPSEKINWIVMDVSALTGSIVARINKRLNDPFIAREAFKLINFVVDKQTDYGAWYYTHPPKDHPRKHDNYHTGYIVDAIYDYMEHTGERQFEEVYWKGLEYYAKNLFLENGAPRWANDATYPLDVHGSAQGIISFLRAARYRPEYVKLAEKIALWAIDNMQHPTKGFFYYQKMRFFRKPFTLMRWSNGWMARGLSELLKYYKTHE